MVKEPIYLFAKETGRQTVGGIVGFIHGLFIVAHLTDNQNRDEEFVLHQKMVFG